MNQNNNAVEDLSEKEQEYMVAKIRDEVHCFSRYIKEGKVGRWKYEGRPESDTRIGARAVGISTDNIEFRDENLQEWLARKEQE